MSLYIILNGILQTSSRLQCLVQNNYGNEQDNVHHCNYQANVRHLKWECSKNIHNSRPEGKLLYHPNMPFLYF